MQKALNKESGMSLCISSNILHFVTELFEERNMVWEKYHRSLSYAAKLKELEAHLSEDSSIRTSEQCINALGSGQAPEEVRLAISEAQAELETVKLLSAEIEGIEKEIKTIQGSYILWGTVILLIGVSVWLWHVGWLVQVLTLLVLFFLFVGKKKR